jgi:hypothetical protein
LLAALGRTLDGAPCTMTPARGVCQPATKMFTAPSAASSHAGISTRITARSRGVRVLIHNAGLTASRSFLRRRGRRGNGRLAALRGEHVPRRRGFVTAPCGWTTRPLSRRPSMPCSSSAGRGGTDAGMRESNASRRAPGVSVEDELPHAGMDEDSSTACDHHNLHSAQARCAPATARPSARSRGVPKQLPSGVPRWDRDRLAAPAGGSARRRLGGSLASSGR